MYAEVIPFHDILSLLRVDLHNGSPFDFMEALLRNEFNKAIDYESIRIGYWHWRMSRCHDLWDHLTRSDNQHGYDRKKKMFKLKHFEPVRG